MDLSGVMKVLFILMATSKIRCRQYFCYDCCDSGSYEDKLTNLKNNLNDKLFGQHIAIRNVLNAVASHFKPNLESSKPLVMSFQGPPGTGKNYVADIIVQVLFYLQLKTKHTKKYLGRSDFSTQKSLSYYKQKLTETIREMVSNCERSVFIFDEVDKMPEGIFDDLTPLLNFNKYIDGYDITKTIFIFLSNSGYENITMTLGNHLAANKKREDIKLEDFESNLRKLAYNSEGGFKGSSLIESSLIDHFIPFLPLERIHVEQCVKVEFEKLGKKGVSQKQINNVVDKEIVYDLKFHRFSVSGCKTMEKKVAIAINHDEL